MSKTLRIRMYNVGFGDCFLLTLPSKRTILVDAGFHSQGKGAFTAKELVQQIIEDTSAVHDGTPRIDVIIATHRHADHVYAFNAPEWEGVEVGEVWMPWLEDRKDKVAVKLWKRQTGFAFNLAGARQSFGLSEEELHKVNFILWNAGVDLPEMQMEAAGGWSNERALDTLHEGFASRDREKPRFLPARDCPESFETDVLPGVKVHVLGPMRDPELIEELDPETDDETYRAMDLMRAEFVGQVAAPFEDAWQVAEAESGFMLDAADVERMNSLARSADAVQAAERVDTMVNSTSLVLVLQIGKARLLLPGDAEWGTWKRILANKASVRILKGATFFKVGHHGSHNATSKTLVEKVLPRSIPAMISTQEGPGNYRKNIPLKELLEALHDHDIAVARSDDEELPEGFAADEEGSRWIDLDVTC